MEEPVGFWTDDFKQHLEHLMEAKTSLSKPNKVLIKDYDDNSTDVTVNFEITFVPDALVELEKQTFEEVVQWSRQTVEIVLFPNTTNMNLFDAKNKLVKYDTTSVNHVRFL